MKTEYKTVDNDKEVEKALNEGWEIVNQIWANWGQNCGLITTMKREKKIMINNFVTYNGIRYTELDINEMIIAMKDFVHRCEIGEVRSKKTYAKFKKLLKEKV